MDGTRKYPPNCLTSPIVVTLIGILVQLSANESFAASPNVAFDVSPAVECRDVTPEVFASANPDEKVIEAKFQVSILVTRGAPDDIQELMITIASPERHMRVVDFAPKTQLVSDVVGDVEKVDSTEVQRSLTASVGGAFSGAYGIGAVQASPTAGAGNVHRTSSKETYKRLPSKEAILVSGTANSEYGVFFKLRPSAQTSLEGTRQFTWRCAVPRSWRGDWALVTCQARCRSKSFFVVESIKSCGRRRVPVALYLRGDSEAKRAALSMVRAQTTVLATKAVAHHAGPGWPHVVLKPILGGSSYSPSARPHGHTGPTAATCRSQPSSRPACRRALSAGSGAARPEPAGKLADALTALQRLSGVH